MGDDSKTMIPGGEVAIVEATPATSLEVLQEIERRNKFLDAIFRAAISATHAGQWMSIGDKPYPAGPAAEVMARRCAVSLGRPEFEKEMMADSEGTYYMWTCYLGASFAGRETITAVGTCTSRDQFFARAKGEDVPQSEIDPGNIKKAAYTNALVNAVTKLLGVRSPSWEQLAACGIKREEVGKAKFASAETAAAAEGGVTPFGLTQSGIAKGTPWVDVSDAGLKVYLAMARKETTKEGKPKPEAFKRKDAAVIAQIEAEQKRRKEVPAAAAPDGDGGSDPAPKLSTAGVAALKALTGGHKLGDLAAEALPALLATIQAERETAGEQRATILLDCERAVAWEIRRRSPAQEDGDGHD